MTRLTTLLQAWADLNLETPPAGAARLGDSPFADRADGAYLPWQWFEPYCVGMDLPIAELADDWDVSDGEDVYWCPRVLLADDVDSPDDRRAFVRVDGVRRWTARPPTG